MAKEPRKQVAYNEPRGAYLRVDYKLPIGTTAAQKRAFAFKLAEAVLAITNDEGTNHD